MFLQDDKPSTTLTRDRASRVLFGDDDLEQQPANTSDAFVNFSYDHNPGQFQELVQSKYPDLVETPAPAVQPDQSFSKYYTVDTPYQAPADPVQKYYNDTNPIPYQSFRPKVLTDFEDLQIGQNSRTDVDQALLQKIDEVQIFEPKVAEDKASFATDIERNTDSDSETYLKLNAKGLIACITFIAVTLLIVLLVIMNSVAIGNTNTQIRRLREQNSERQQEFNEADFASSQARARGEAAARRVAEDGTFADGTVATQPDRIVLPPIASYPLAPANPDYSTNLFDQIAKFFNSIFG